MQRKASEHAMTKLLEEGIQAVRELSPERQDMVGELLLSIAASAPQSELSREQIDDLRLSIEQADRGEFANAAEIAEVWKKFGL
jgi:hypothetical protein